MKNHILIFISICLIQIGCAKIDKSDIVSIASSLEQSLIDGNIEKIKPLFEYNMDSISQAQKENLEEIQNFYTKNEFKKIDIDTSTYWSDSYCHIYYVVDSNYYEVTFVYSRDSLNEISIYGIYFKNINEECTKTENQAYCPKSEISFERFMWLSNYDLISFNAGKVAIKNNTNQEISFVKFRVTISKGNINDYDEPFFNQTIESYKTIYKGDIAELEIPGMTNFYVGFQFSNKNLKFNAELIEIEPKPISHWCLKLKELDEKVKKNK